MSDKDGQCKQGISPEVRSQSDRPLPDKVPCALPPTEEILKPASRPKPDGPFQIPRPLLTQVRRLDRFAHTYDPATRGMTLRQRWSRRPREWRFGCEDSRLKLDMADQAVPASVCRLCSVEMTDRMLRRHSDSTKRSSWRTLATLTRPFQRALQRLIERIRGKG